jgi:hypothetical protein
MSTEPATMSALESEMTSEAPARRRWYRQPIAWVASDALGGLPAAT